MSELRVVSVSIKDVLGAREFALEPGGQITLLAGRNGSGKSTALQALQAALGGGNLARLARVPKGDEAVEPEVVLVIEGQGSEAYRVERKGDKVRVRERVDASAAFADVGKPQAWLRSLYDPRGSNPVTLLTAADKDVALLILEALDLKMDRAALLVEMGIRADELPPIPAGLHPLEEIALIRDAVFRQRTGVNRDQKGKAAAAEQTRRNAPAVIPEDPGRAAEAALEQEIQDRAQAIARDEEKAAAAEREAVGAARASYQNLVVKVEESFKSAAGKIRAKHAQEVADVRAEAERRIAEMLSVTNATIDGLRESDEATIDKAEDLRDGAIQAAATARGIAEEGVGEKRTEWTAAKERLATMRAQREGSAKAQALHDQAKEFDAEAEKLLAEADRLTAALAALDAFRRRLAKDLPIDGLEIEGREIRVNGVPFSQLNTQARVDIAVQVACLRAKGSRLPVVFVDGAEALDHEHFEHLVARLKAAGVQAFLGRVEDTDLTVTTDVAPVGA